jgi:hypothetical protein
MELIIAFLLGCLATIYLNIFLFFLAFLMFMSQAMLRTSTTYWEPMQNVPAPNDALIGLLCRYISFLESLIFQWMLKAGWGRDTVLATSRVTSLPAPKDPSEGDSAS